MAQELTSKLQALMDSSQPEGLNYSAFRVSGRKVLNPSTGEHFRKKVGNSIAELEEALVAPRESLNLRFPASSGDKTNPPAMSTILNFDPIVLERTVSTPIDEILDKVTLLELANVTKEDSRLATIRWMVNQNSLVGIKGGEKKYRSQLNRLAIRQSAQRANEMRAAMVTYKSAPKVAHPLLLEFFMVCQRPNPTEIRYLAQQTAVTPMVVAAWFAEQRKRNAALTLKEMEVKREAARFVKILSMSRDRGHVSGLEGLISHLDLGKDDVTLPSAPFPAVIALRS